jgi:hypothetical protein
MKINISNDINKIRILISFFLLAQGFSVFFIQKMGDTVVIDEIFLFMICPLAAMGIKKTFQYAKIPTTLITFTLSYSSSVL